MMVKDKQEAQARSEKRRKTRESEEKENMSSQVHITPQS